MKISIGADHRGFLLKQVLIKHFNKHTLQGGAGGLACPGHRSGGLHESTFHIEWIDVGATSDNRTDYPPFAKAVCKNIKSGAADCGILICGSGVGMSIAANRFKGIYAALAWTPAVAQAAKEDDNANVLVLPSNFVPDLLAIEIVTAWLNARFKDGVYVQRLEMIDKD